MTQVVSIGYQTFREAVGQIENAIFAGQPDRPAVLKARDEEGDVGDDEASQKAVAELWTAVDEGRRGRWQSAGSRARWFGCR